jgi:hypothetical protein
VDDYHRYDRAQRRDVPFTVLHPDCNYIEALGDPHGSVHTTVQARALPPSTMPAD